MIATDVLRAGTVLCFLLIRTPELVWLLYFLTAVQFSLSALFTPARTAVIANIVPRKDLVTANALDSLTWSTMLALGALLGGVVAAVFGVQTAFVLDGLTFLLSAWLISRIVVAPREEETAVSESEHHGFLKAWFEFIEGFRYLWQFPFILGISLAKAAGSLVWGAINVLEITFANEVFLISSPFLIEVLKIESGSTAVLGVIYLVSGLGTGLGPLFIRRLLGDGYVRLLWGIAIGFSLLGVGILALSAAPGMSYFLVATLVRTVGSGVVWVFSAALLQMLVPDYIRGRVFAFEFAMLTLTQSISILGAGFMLDAGLNVRQTTAVFGFLGFVVSVLWLIFVLSNLGTAKNLQQSALSGEANIA